MENNRTLLIIDDEPDVCSLLKVALRKRFKRVEFAYNLADGLAKAIVLHPDVILLDHNLPDGYGLDYIATFRKDEHPVRIIMVSAMDLHTEALAAGADAFVGKPVILSELHAVA